MHCFNHQDRDAVGSCKACAKGLCAECAVDLGHGLSCKGEHELTVQSYKTILDFNTRTVAAAPRTMYLAPAFFAAMGFSFVWFGYHEFHNIQNFPMVMGGAFLVYSSVLYSYLRFPPRNRA